jgi:hypothetical protein
MHIGKMKYTKAIHLLFGSRVNCIQQIILIIDIIGVIIGTVFTILCEAEYFLLLKLIIIRPRIIADKYIIIAPMIVFCCICIPNVITKPINKNHCR